MLVSWHKRASSHRFFEILAMFFTKMVAGFYTANTACEDQSTTWSNQQTNFTSVKSSTCERRPRTSGSSRRSSKTSNHHSQAVMQDEPQNSINNELNSVSGTKTRISRRWSEQADTQASASFNNLLWNGVKAPASTSHTPAAQHPKTSKKTSTEDHITSPNTPTAATTAAASATQREASFYQRIAEWELNTTNPCSDNCDCEVRTTVKTAQSQLRAEEYEGNSSSGSSSGHSSPALSTSEESKQSSSNSPNSPPLGDDIAVQAVAAAATENTSEALRHTLQEDTATVTAKTSAAAPSSMPSCALSSSASSSPSPSFTMADIVAALRSSPEDQHPFLDMHYQRNLREHERAQDHLNQQVVQSFQHQFSGQQQAAAFKCLLNAAHRWQYQQCMRRDTAAAAEERSATDSDCVSGARAPSCAGRWGPRQRRLINHQWRMTAEQAECDLYREGLGVVQRKLSCMCLFNPDTDVRIYDENCSMREQRCYRQHKLLIRLQRQRLRGGNLYFLDDLQQEAGTRTSTHKK